MRMNKQRILALLLGALFIYSGAIKLWDPAGFAQQVEAYKILPKAAVPTFAMALPVFELLTGTFLVVNRRVREALFCCIAMLVVFTVALISLKARGIETACGCFGNNGGEIWFAIGRDLLLLAILVPIYLRGWRHQARKTQVRV